MPPKPKLPHVERTTAKGRVYWYVRYKGQRIARLPNDPDSAQYFEVYAAALRQIADDPKPPERGAGSLNWLVSSYRASNEFKRLSAKTRASYARELNRLKPIGAFSATEIKRKHIRAIRDKLAGTPRTQQMFGQVVSLLFNFGIRELDLEMLNPAAKLRRSDDPESYAPWTVEQMAKFEASNPPPELMTAYMISRYTGPRRGDAASLTRAHWDGEALSIAGSKTGHRITVRAHARLKDYLNALPNTLTLIADELGRPVSPDQISKRLRAHLDAIGLEDLHLHGLRHTAGTELAEAGCSTHEIAAVLGHKTLQMVERYTKRAQQAGLATAAILRLERKQNGK